MIKDWKNKKVAILGIGIEGLSTAQFLAEKECSISMLDKKNKEDFDKNTLDRIKASGTRLILGKNYLDNLMEFDIVIRSPGISINTPQIIDAAKKGTIITSHTKIFFDLCPGIIIGVTGTKGKGTTSTLIYEMLQKSGRDTFLGGNIGNPPLDFIDKLKQTSIVVLELSSFQLADLDKSPHIAVMLMVTSEHLDYHKDVYEYVEAKRNILRFQQQDDYAVINRDYIASNESDIHTAGKVFYISRERATSDQGAFVHEDAIWMRMLGSEWKIIDTKNIALLGKHNLENAAAASVAATLAGADKASIVEALKTFTGLPHRLELVAEINGVSYYNDSFSTTPETAVAAIESFKQPEILILGGSSKNSDFSELGEVVSKAENIKAIIGIGEEWERIKSKVKSQKSKALLVEGAKDMETVVKAASKIAVPGDVVLLSPGCASFGMFQNYKDRGEQFKREVEKLKGL